MTAKIKPLDWEKDGVFIATSLGGAYVVYTGGLSELCSAEFPVRAVAEITPFGTDVDAAIAACNADHERRLREWIKDGPTAAEIRRHALEDAAACVRVEQRMAQDVVDHLRSDTMPDDPSLERWMGRLAAAQEIAAAIRALIEKEQA